VKKITKPFVFLEISTTKEYGHGSDLADGDLARTSAAKPEAKPAAKTAKKAKK